MGETDWHDTLSRMNEDQAAASSIIDKSREEAFDSSHLFPDCAVALSGLDLAP